MTRRNIKVENVKFVIEEQGKQVEIDGCKVTTKSDTVYFNYEAYIANFFVILIAELPDYKCYSDEEIVNMMKEQAQKDYYKCYSTEEVVREFAK